MRQEIGEGKERDELSSSSDAAETVRSSPSSLSPERKPELVDLQDRRGVHVDSLVLSSDSQGGCARPQAHSTDEGRLAGFDPSSPPSDLYSTNSADLVLIVLIYSFEALGYRFVIFPTRSPLAFDCLDLC